jgi:hypothetical protein
MIPSSANEPSTSDRAAGILQYQENRTLDRCPGFSVSAQVASKTGERFFIGLRPEGLELFTSRETQILFDLEGRPVRFSTPTEYRFRGVSHEGTVVLKGGREARSGWQRQVLEAEELERSCREAWEMAAEAGAALEADTDPRWAMPDPAAARAALAPILKKIGGWSPERLREEKERFSRVYQPVPVLPPDHYSSLVLQATEGCSFNTCTFCSLYRGIPFRVRTKEQFSRHVAEALAFHGAGLVRYSQIFLGQANALAAPQARLVELMQHLRDQVELPEPGGEAPRPAWVRGHPLRFLGVGSFLDGFTGLRKSAGDYAELRRLGLTRVYLGVESGCADLLRWMEKPATPGEMLQTVRHLKEAGLATDVILLVGAGGARFAEEHLRASLEFLAQSALVPGDRVYLSEIVEGSGAPYRARMDAEEISRLDGAALQEQKEALAAGGRRLGLQAVPYRLEPFVY